MRKCLQVVSLREQVDERHFLDSVAGREQTPEITRQCGWITGNDAHQRRTELSQTADDGLAQACAGWIEQHEIRRAVERFQVFLRRGFLRGYIEAACALQIESQI